MKWLKKLINKILNLKSPEELKQIGGLKKEIKRLKAEISVKENDISNYTSVMALNEKKIKELQEKIKELEAMSSDYDKIIFEYWYNKYNKSKQRMWRGVNVINYCTKNSNEVPKVEGKNDDEKANNALKFIQKYVKYVSDKREHWQFANETVKHKKGDCEDGAILMYNIMRASGVTKERIRLNAGDVKGGGHAYITYLREADNIWYILDWCYWFRESVDFKKTWREAEKYFGIWFSWNEDYVWSKPTYIKKK